jgi:hypothetical protein
LPFIFHASIFIFTMHVSKSAPSLSRTWLFFGNSTLTISNMNSLMFWSSKATILYYWFNYIFLFSERYLYIIVIPKIGVLNIISTQEEGGADPVWEVVVVPAGRRWGKGVGGLIWYKHVCKWKNDTSWNYSRNGGRGHKAEGSRG